MVFLQLLGIFPNVQFPKGQLPKCQFPKWQHPKCSISQAQQLPKEIMLGPLRTECCGQSQGAELCGQGAKRCSQYRSGSCRSGNCTFGKMQLGKNTLGKLQLGKNSIGKYQHFFCRLKKKKCFSFLTVQRKQKATADSENKTW